MEKNKFSKIEKPKQKSNVSVNIRPNVSVNVKPNTNTKLKANDRAKAKLKANAIEKIKKNQTYEKPIKWDKEIVTVYVAPQGFEHELEFEIANHGFMHRRLGFVDSTLKKTPLWQEQIWRSPQVFEFESIKQASELLKSYEKKYHGGQPVFWINASQDFHRRSALIGENLKLLKFKELHFLETIPEKKSGLFCFA